MPHRKNPLESDVEQQTAQSPETDIASLVNNQVTKSGYDDAAQFKLWMYVCKSIASNLSPHRHHRSCRGGLSPLSLHLYLFPQLILARSTRPHWYQFLHSPIHPKCHALQQQLWCCVVIPARCYSWAPPLSPTSHTPKPPLFPTFLALHRTISQLLNNVERNSMA